MRSTTFCVIDVHMTLKIVLFFLQIVIHQLISILKQSYQSYDYMHTARTCLRFNKNVFKMYFFIILLDEIG